MDAAQALASDRFISFSTWNWVERVSQKSKQASYYYLYDHVRPVMRAQYRDDPKSEPQIARGAVHSAEIEYALGNLDVNNIYEWDKTDYKVSTLMQQYFVNFIKTGDPNDKTLPKWPLFSSNKQLRITENPRVEDMRPLSARYEFHRGYYANKGQ
jgi:para-nitrobenzyl esterase